ncbi:PAS domain-containing protein [Streptacidiphilus fuscans]|uniref:PAS domain-containing protein n=1 Tax=Streptacidiphilus fuscans TaxID=2789292 RepID=UPI002E2D913C|nr:PAS domain-containing protein [Streptacidiphilus fuscans]
MHTDDDERTHGRTDQQLLGALLEGMEVGLAALDADGVVTHWNREAARLLGWSAAEAVGRRGLEGWAVRPADAEEVRAGLQGAPDGVRVLHEFPLLTRDGRRTLVRAQVSSVRTSTGRTLCHYFAFSEACAQTEWERSLALAHSLLDEAQTGAVLVDADLRPATVGDAAARWLDCERSALLGRPLGEVLQEGVPELEAALQRTLSTGKSVSGVKLWVTLRSDPARRRCLRSEFVRLGSPLGEEPVPLGVVWLFEDVTLHEQAEQEASVLRFRTNQLRRAGLAAAECADGLDAAAGYLDFVLAGFADHALLDVLRGDALVRVAASPLGGLALGDGLTPTGLPARYGEVHPALRALERCGTVAVSDSGAPAFATLSAQLSAPPSAGAPAGLGLGGWAELRRWPEGTLHGLCTPLRSRGRSHGVLTFLRGPGRPRFDRADCDFAEDVAARVAAAVDLSGEPSHNG